MILSRKDIVRAVTAILKQKKEPQPTPKRASAEALGVCRGFKRECNIDLYSRILKQGCADRKTYGGTSPKGLQSEKTAIFDLYHDSKSALHDRFEK